MPAKKRVTGFAAYVKKNYHTEAKKHHSKKPPTVIRALAKKYNKKK